MAAIYGYDDVVRRLRESPTNISCALMKKMLEDLGFQVIKGSKGNHHGFKHPAIPTFYGGKFDCGHKSALKPCYPRDVLSILVDLESELKPKPKQEIELKRQKGTVV